MERTSRTATGWAKLPPAVIGFVLYHVAQQAALDHTLAQYATVNKDWQYLFEQFNFRSLDLGPEDLHGFETIVSTHSNRRKWLRTVSLHVVDHEDAHLDGGSAEQPEQQAPRAVVSLLGLLKEWDTDSNLCLALCLSAPTTSSPETGQGTASHQNSAALQSPDRLYQPEEDGLSHMVEQVPAIKAFSIRYEEAQVISSRAVLDLCSRLPKLEELRIHDPHRRNNYTKHFNIAKLAPELPWTLKRLHILGEDSTRKTPKSVCQFLVQRLVWFGMTIGLQELSITTSGYAAEEFFDCFRSMAPGSAASEIRHWPALQSLTLTCSLLRPSATRAAVDPLLHQAGLAALELYLPHLRELRLLSHKAGDPKEVDGFFHYAATGQGKNVATCVGESTQCSWKSPPDAANRYYSI